MGLEGSVTVTEQNGNFAHVLGPAISVARIDAVNCELLTNVVEREVPFHMTAAPETNPVPLTVMTNAAPPGAAELGEVCMINGTGFSAIATPVTNSIINSRV